MNRQIVYPGAIPLETDLLNTNKYSMLGLAKLASSLMGGNTYVHGLACTPSSQASMVVNVAAGQIYSLQNIDGTAYSSLPADTTHSILKQGYVLDAQQFTLTAPSTSGYSINYLIQATYADVDGGSTVLPYYNAANPSVAWSGPNNSGTSQYTVRQGVCTVSLKAGVAATTGTQVTPSPDSGCIGLYVITVAQGATTVTAGNIATYANAPFLPQGGIVDGIQRSTMTYAADTGVANAYVVNINPGILTLSDGMVVNFKATNANTTSSTLNVCSLGAFPVLNKFGQTLIAGEIASGSHVTVKWSASASSWLILDSTIAVPTAPTAATATNNTQIASTAFVQAVITALALGTASQRNVGTGTNQVPDMSFFTLGLSGAFRLPTGHIIQTGSGTTASGGFTQAYPYPFPGACLALIGTVYGTLGQRAFVTANSSNRTAANLNVVDINGNGLTASVGYIAIGY